MQFPIKLCYITCYISDVCLRECNVNLAILGRSISDKAAIIIDKIRLEN